MLFTFRSLLCRLAQDENYGAVKLDSSTKPGCVFCDVSRSWGFDIILEVL